MQIALGCMAMSGVYGPTNDEDSIRTIQHAIHKGVTLIDTGDFYGMGHNEMLVGRAIKGHSVTLSVKFGAQRGPDGAWLGFDARPAAVKTACAYSLKRLGVDCIDIYRPARLDANVPIEETMGALADLVKTGYVKKIGLSEVGSETIKKAAKVHAIHDLQIEYSIASRVPERDIFPTLHALGISATLYGVYSRGLLTGSKPQKGDSRGWFPRFQKAQQNAPVVEKIAALAKEHKRTPGQLLLGWVMAKEPKFIAVVGAKTIAQLDDALAATALSAEEMRELEAVGDITGTRYGEEQMKHLDSER